MRVTSEFLDWEQMSTYSKYSNQPVCKSAASQREHKGKERLNSDSSHILSTLASVSLPSSQKLYTTGKFWFSFFFYKNVPCSLCICVYVFICVCREVPRENWEEHWSFGGGIVVILSTWVLGSQLQVSAKMPLTTGPCLQPRNQVFKTSELDFRSDHWILHVYSQ